MKPHHHPAYQPANPPLDFAAIHLAAMADLETVFELWHRDGRPCVDLQVLNPDALANDRRIKHFHIISQLPFRWADLNGTGQGRDLISVVEHLADVPRDVAANFLRDRLDSAARHRRPTENAG